MDFNHILLKYNKIHYYQYWDRFRYRYLAKKKNEYLTDLNLPDNIISIIMPLKTKKISLLKKTINSVINQSNKNWELYIICLSSLEKKVKKLIKRYNNNPQIKIVFLKEIDNIPELLNYGIINCLGNYVTILNTGDNLERDFLEKVNESISKFNPEIIYVDEDYREKTLIHSILILPKFKPDYSPDLLLSYNYISHGVIYKRNLIEKVGTFNRNYDEEFEYDYILRSTELANSICHIRKVLYHQVKHYSKKNANNIIKLNNRKNIINESLIRTNRQGEIIPYLRGELFRIKYKFEKLPHVTIIIPFKDKSDLLDLCLESIISKTTYPFYDILIVDNMSEEQKTRDIIIKWESIDNKIKCIDYQYEFNFSAINNYAVSKAYGDYIVLMNNDIQIITPSWIESLLEYAQHEEIGAVGAKLYYPNGTIQHAGISLGVGGLAGHPYCRFPSFVTGYNNDLFSVRNVSGVTGALMMLNKLKYLEIGGLEEKNLKVAYNDVDFCLKLLERGYLNIITPFCEAIHGESLSRGYEDTQEKLNRFNSEIRYFMKRHESTIYAGDPWYNQNYSTDNSFMRLNCFQSNEKVFGVHMKKIYTIFK